MTDNALPFATGMVSPMTTLDRTCIRETLASSQGNDALVSDRLLLPPPPPPPCAHQSVPREDLVGVKLSTALEYIEDGRDSDLLDIIIEKYQALNDRGYDFIVVMGHHAVGMTWHRKIAAALGLPVVLVGSVPETTRPEMVKEECMKSLSGVESSTKVGWLAGWLAGCDPCGKPCPPPVDTAVHSRPHATHTHTHTHTHTCKTLRRTAQLWDGHRIAVGGPAPHHR